MKEPGHIGLNIVFLEPGMGGMETYVNHLIPEILELRPGLRVTAFVNPAAKERLAAQPWASDVSVATHPFLGRRYTRALSELTVLGPIADRRRVDVLHSLGMTAPLRLGAATVVTVPDLIWLYHPGSLSRVTTSLWRVVVPVVARRADRVLTFSAASRNDIVRHLGVPQERVDVALLGPGSSEVADPTPEDDLRTKLGLGEGAIVLAVSTKVEHKNLRRLVEATASLRREHPDAVLVLPGHPTAHEDELRLLAESLGIGDRVRFLGWLSSPELEGLYRAATCFVYPSLREGFGLPVLEAMRRGLPVACSNTSSVPEVGGDAVLYFDPLDTRSMAAAVSRLLSDERLRAELRAKGLERQKAFTWRATAEATLDSYSRAFAEHR